MGYLIAVNWLDKKQWLTLLTAIFISGVLAALVGIAQYLLNFSAVIQAAPPASFFGNKNMGAHYALLTFPLGIALFWIAKTTTKQWLFAIGNSFIIIYIFYSTARAAWLSAFISTIFLIIAFTLLKQLSFSKSRIQSILASLLLIAIFSHLNNQGFNPNALNSFGNEVSSIADQATTNFNNSNVRLIKWRNAWDLYKDNWLIGIGLNNWLIEYPIYHQRYGNDSGVRLDSQSDHTHNDYIQLVVETGTIGLLLFVSLLVLIIRQLYRFFTHDDLDLQQALLLIGVVGALIAIGIDALFSFPLQLPHTMFLFLLYLGIVSSIAQPIKTVIIKNKQTKPYMIGFGLASIASIILYTQWFQAEAWFRKANFDIEAKSHQAAIVSAEKAYKYNPYKYDMLKYRAISLKNVNHPDSEKAILAVLDSYPNNLNSLNRAVNFYSSQRRMNDALIYALRMEALAPRSAYVYQNLAAVYQGLGRHDLVVSNIKKLLAVDPDNPNAATYKKLLEASAGSK